MAQTFKWPNLVAGTGEWSAWVAPKNVDNFTWGFAVVEFPRAIEEGDVVCTCVEFEFDGLDLTADHAHFYVQGPVDHSWGYQNVITTAIGDGWPYSQRHGVTLDGRRMPGGTFTVPSGCSAIGHTMFNFGIRIDYCGGGRLRTRRLMVTLNGDGVPHAWAPAAGEVWP